MKLGLVLLAVVLTGCTPAVDFAGLKTGPRDAQFHDHITAARLENGLKVAVLPDARTNLVTVTVRYEVGGGDDPPDASGLAHYVEHLLGQKPMWVTAGLDGNAMTLSDRTYFYASALDTQLDMLLEMAAGRFGVRCDDFSGAELARERDVVIEEAKLRSRPEEVALMPVVWGAGHPYARDTGGAGFAAISHDRLCAFIDQHYGPGAATLVITGNVDASVLQRVRDQFSKIAARPLASREQLPPLARDIVHVGVPGLDRATAAIVFHVPGEGSPEDPAIEVLDGMRWNLGRHAPTRVARTIVLGDERARVVVAYAQVDDLTQLDKLAAALQQTFAHPTFSGLRPYQQQQRTRFVHSIENSTSAGIEIADLVARNAPLTRYRHLQAIDALKPEDITRWISGTGDRVLELLPEGNRTGSLGIGGLATALHDVDVPRDDGTATSPPPAPSRRIGPAVVEDKLANGLTVWYSQDPDAISIDARVVIRSEAPLAEAMGVATQAAFLLRHRAVGADDGDRIEWYRSIGVNVVPEVEQHATTFRISGFALFGDWHVWNLAWTLIESYYPSYLAHRRFDDLVGREPPSTIEILARRLRGDRGSASLELHSADELERYRRTHYDPRHATLIIAGNFDLEAMRREVRQLFSRWTSTAEPPAAEASPAPAPGYVAVPVLHAPTLGIVLGFASSAGPLPSEAAARAVLSELINDRVRVIRERMGVTYGVYAFDGPAVLVGGPVEPAYGAEAARSLLDAIARVRAGDPQLAADFARARKRVLAQRLAEPLGASARAAELQRAATMGQGVGSLDAELDAIRNLDLEAVRAIAQRDMRPENMIAVVRGDPDAVKATLAALGATAFDTVTR